MNIQNRFKRWFKLRFAILYPAGILIALFSNSTDDSTMAGIWFILAGLCLRAWANGYAIKSSKLTTCGPYAFVRHPLYLGTIILVIGFLIMLNLYYIGIFFLSMLIAVYYRKTQEEEALLERKFKDVYADYKKKIPAFLPSIRPYQAGEKWPFSFKRLIKSQEYKLFLWMLVLVIAFHLKDELMVEHEALNAKIIGLFIVAFLLGMVDLVGELLGWRKIKD